MPTATLLEFSSLTGSPANCKLYNIGDIETSIVAESSSVEEIIDTETDGTGRYEVLFIDLPDGDYQLVAFDSGVIPIVHEKYSVIEGSRAQPWREAKPLTVDQIAAQLTVTPSLAYGLNRSIANTVALYNAETQTVSITVLDSAGAAVSLSGKTLAVYVETVAGASVATIASGSITIGGTGNNVISFASTSAMTTSVRELRYAIRDASAPRTVYAKGSITIDYAPYAQS